MTMNFGIVWERRGINGYVSSVMAYGNLRLTDNFCLWSISCCLIIKDIQNHFKKDFNSPFNHLEPSFSYTAKHFSYKPSSMLCYCGYHVCAQPSASCTANNFWYTYSSKTRCLTIQHHHFCSPLTLFYFKVPLWYFMLNWLLECQDHVLNWVLESLDHLLNWLMECQETAWNW